MSEIRGLGQTGFNPQGEIGQPKVDSKGPSFADILKEKATVAQAPVNGGLKFSTHAVERMNSRGIRLEPRDVERIGQAIDKAEKKGSKDTLVLMGNNAFIVNVKNKTVVTAMDQSLMKENVFTNIDSTVLL